METAVGQLSEPIDETKSDEDQLKDALRRLKWGIDWWVQAIDKIPIKLKQEIADTKDYGFLELSNELVSAIEKIKQFEQTIDTKRKELSEKFEAMAEAIYTQYGRAKKKIDELPAITVPKIETFHLEKIIGLLAQIDRYDDKTWARFAVIAKALSPAVTPE